MKIILRKKLVDKIKVKKEGKVEESTIDNSNSYNSAIKRYMIGCNLFFKRKVKFVGDNILAERIGKGPVIIIGTHKESIEPMLLQTTVKEYIHWFSSASLSRPIKGSKFSLSKIEILRRLNEKLENLEIDRRNLKSHELKIQMDKGVKLLLEGKALGSFPVGHAGKSGLPFYSEPVGIGSSGIIYVASKAEQLLGIKIPVILCSIKMKSDGYYYISQKEIELPEEFDRKELIKDYMKQIDSIYLNI